MASYFIQVDKWDYFQNRPQDFFFSISLIMKPLSEVAPGLLVIQIQIQVWSILFFLYAYAYT